MNVRQALTYARVFLVHGPRSPMLRTLRDIHRLREQPPSQSH